ncbi:hypothetical protein MMC11_007375 [Xylographa trunciseda]|nr:hypothetical protein [Xylographa trunciseda]
MVSIRYFKFTNRDAFKTTAEVISEQCIHYSKLPWTQIRAHCQRERIELQHRASSKVQLKQPNLLLPQRSSHYSPQGEEPLPPHAERNLLLGPSTRRRVRGAISVERDDQDMMPRSTKRIRVSATSLVDTQAEETTRRGSKAGGLADADGEWGRNSGFGITTKTSNSPLPAEFSFPPQGVRVESQERVKRTDTTKAPNSPLPADCKPPPQGEGIVLGHDEVSLGE